MLKPESLSALKNKRKLTMLTAYDYPTAKILAQAGIDILLVGDSLGMVVLGYPDTRSVTLQDMVRHTAGVVRGCKAVMKTSRPLIVVDMPIHTTDTAGIAISNCRFVLEQTGADAVKIEGNPRIVQVLHEAHIPVMGHTGLKPQYAEEYKIHGREKLEADIIEGEAVALEKAGAFAVVLECITAKLAQKITQKLKVPTIGIGASAECDGQVLVVSDLIGLYDDIKPKFVRRYANIAQIMRGAVLQFKNDTESGDFPSKDESY